MSKLSPVRVRFAPSPTGNLHVGGMRSALFNWLLARHTGGVFILRIEDTDRARLVPEAIDQISQSLDSLELTPDEGPTQGGAYGPYLQSERLDLYARHAETLIQTGTLYPCWCTPERLAQLRTTAQAQGTAFKYDRHCLTHRQDLAEPHVLRFRVPDAPPEIGWDDAVRGQMTVATGEQDDFVAIKSDGYPTYHFANVVDDHLMEITHVLRADEWIASTPKHLLLCRAFGWEPPIYGHLPAILGSDGQKKLSKRDGALAAEDYLREGYLVETLTSFLATLGWNDGTTQEIYTRRELIERFSLDRIQKSPARFDKDRLSWMNGVLIRQLDPAELDQRAESFWPASATDQPASYRQAVLGLVQERLKYLAELPALTDFFFTEPEPTAPQLLQGSKLSPPEATSCLEVALAGLQQATDQTSFTAHELEPLFREQLFAKLHDRHPESLTKVGPFFMVLRVALTAQTATPGLFEMMEVLGPKRVTQRLKLALTKLNPSSADKNQ